MDSSSGTGIDGGVFSTKTSKKNDFIESKLMDSAERTN
jgi:hypothetical protein